MRELGATLALQNLRDSCSPAAQFCECRKLGIAESLPADGRTPTVGSSLPLRYSQIKMPYPSVARAENTEEKASANHVPTLFSKCRLSRRFAVEGEQPEDLIALPPKNVPGIQGRKWHIVSGPAKSITRYLIRAITLLHFLIEVRELPRIAGSHAFPLGDVSTCPSPTSQESARPLGGARFKHPPSAGVIPFVSYNSGHAAKCYETIPSWPPLSQPE